MRLETGLALMQVLFSSTNIKVESAWQTGI